MARDTGVSVEEFIDDMGSNPLGIQQEVKQVGQYIVEYYADSFTLDHREKRPRLQVYRLATPDDNHFREWMRIADDDDFDESDIRVLYDGITESDIDDVVGDV